MTQFQTFSHAGKIRFHFSGESAGKQIRTDTMQAGIIDRLTPVNVPVIDVTGTVPVKPVSEYQTFMDRRKMEYRICKRVLDRRYKQLAIFCKRDNSHKIMLAIAIFTPKGIAILLVDGTKLTPYARVSGNKLSENAMHKLFGIDQKTGLKVYAQSVKEVIRSYEWKTTQKANQAYSGTPVPADRKPQKYIMRGKPMHDVEHATRQEDPRRHDYGMVAKPAICMLKAGSTPELPPMRYGTNSVSKLPE